MERASKKTKIAKFKKLAQNTSKSRYSNYDDENFLAFSLDQIGMVLNEIRGADEEIKKFTGAFQTNPTYIHIADVLFKNLSTVNRLATKNIPKLVDVKEQVTCVIEDAIRSLDLRLKKNFENSFGRFRNNPPTTKFINTDIQIETTSLIENKSSNVIACIDDKLVVVDGSDYTSKGLRNSNEEENECEIVDSQENVTNELSEQNPNITTYKEIKRLKKMQKKLRKVISIFQLNKDTKDSQQPKNLHAFLRDSSSLNYEKCSLKIIENLSLLLIISQVLCLILIVEIPVFIWFVFSVLDLTN